MSENIYSKLQEANERHEQIERGNRLVPLAAAIIAVLAALGTLFTHHQSILALNKKNEAIIMQARASDYMARYETAKVRYSLANALLVSDLATKQTGRDALAKIVSDEGRNTEQLKSKADEFGEKTDVAEVDAERILRSYETLQLGTTFCEVAIVLISISALVRTRIFLTIGCTVAAAGLATLLVGYFQGH